MKRSIATLAFASVLLSTAAYAQSVGERRASIRRLGLHRKRKTSSKKPP
jgi:hypothetical protein